MDRPPERIDDRDEAGMTERTTGTLYGNVVSELRLLEEDLPNRTRE